MKLILHTIIIILLSASVTSATSIVRDAETEALLSELSHPVLRIAGLDPKSVNLYIIQSDTLNAFVAGGQNIFFHTKLLTFSDTPETFLGVLAHEAGHITGGHLMKTGDQAETLTATTALGYILGAATAIAGAPGVGQAIAAGGQHLSQRLFLKHTRTQEQSADQAGLSYLQQLGYSPKGLLNLLEALKQEQSRRYGELDPYILTHPISGERISHIRNHMRTHTLERSLPKDLTDRYTRMVAKLNAFLESPSKTLLHYPKSDTSPNARYARSIAYYKKPDIANALSEINGLIQDFPNDPYYHEMKGQILFENGRVTEAIGSYAQSVKLRPSNALLKVQLATASIAAEEPSLLAQAITLLKQGLVTENKNAFAWHQLGIAYGRQGQLGMSYLALTEEAVLTKRWDDAKDYITYAQEHLDKGSPEMIRLIDLKRLIERET